MLEFGALARDMFASVFVDGSVRTPAQLLAMVRAPSNLPVFVFAGDRPIGLAWLNGCAGSYAFGHFMFLRGGRGTIAREAGRRILDYWMGFADGDEPLFDVILGMVPAWNTRAIDFVVGLGLVRLGDIPKILHGHPATVLYYARSTWDHH